jgi:hypothetical protein
VHFGVLDFRQPWLIPVRKSGSENRLRQPSGFLRPRRTNQADDGNYRHDEGNPDEKAGDVVKQIRLEHMDDEERELWRLGDLQCVMVSCCSGAELQVRRDERVLLRELYPGKTDLFERARELKSEYERGAANSGSAGPQDP